MLAFIITGSVYAAPDDLDAGFMVEVGTGFAEPLNAVALESDGSLLVGGTYGSYQGGGSSAMWRLNADGTVADIIDGFATTTGLSGNQQHRRSAGRKDPRGRCI